MSCVALNCENCTGAKRGLPAYAGRVARAAVSLSYFPADVSAILKRDPAINTNAFGFLEVPLYGSFWAMLLYRIAHLLHAPGLPFVPRLISQVARLLTGIEIHPGAKVLGAVCVGSGALVGAQSVALTDVPADSTAVGVPARVIPHRPARVAGGS